MIIVWSSWNHCRYIYVTMCTHRRARIDVTHTRTPVTQIKRQNGDRKGGTIARLHTTDAYGTRHRRLHGTARYCETAGPGVYQKLTSRCRAVEGPVSGWLTRIAACSNGSGPWNSWGFYTTVTLSVEPRSRYNVCRIVTRKILRFWLAEPFGSCMVPIARGILCFISTLPK